MSGQAEGDTGHKGLIQDHPYVQRDPWAWWSVCKECGLAEAAHAESTRLAKPAGAELYCSECGVHLTEQEVGTCSVCYGRLTEAEL